jgi:hypothetical protein
MLGSTPILTFALQQGPQHAGFARWGAKPRPHSPGFINTLRQTAVGFQAGFPTRAIGATECLQTGYPEESLRTRGRMNDVEA